MTTFRLRSILGSASLLLAAVGEACGSPDSATIPSPAADSGTPTAPVVTATQATATVGASGGNVTTTGGTGVEIPAGALPNNVQVSVVSTPTAAPPANATELGTPTVFGPSGLQFAQPVTVVLEFDATKLPAGKTAADIVVYTAPEGTTSFTALPTTIQDATHVQAQTTHFSVFVPTIPAAPSGDDADGGASTADAGSGCTQRLCGFYGPGTCGTQDDGCGGSLDCGTCLGGSADGGAIGGSDGGAPAPDAGVGGGGSDASGGSADGGSTCQNPLTCANYETASGAPLCASFDATAAAVC